MWRIIHCFFGLWIWAASAQEPYTLHFGRKDGLPTTNVYCAVPDSDGYMWFGTDMGILRFDGARFRHYSAEDGLADNEVFGCYQDKAGRMWFATYNGRLSYFQNGHFYNESNDKRLRHRADPTMILKTTGDQNGNVYFFQRAPQYLVFDAKNGCRIVPNDRSPAESIDIYRLNGEECFVNRFGLVDSRGNRRFSFWTPRDSKHICRSLRHGSILYFSDGDRLYSFDGHTQAVVADLALKDNEIISIFIDSEDDLWIGTRNGVFRRKRTDTREKFVPILRGHAVSSVSEDFEGGIWVTTLDDGIFLIPSKRMAAIKRRNGSDIIANCLSAREGELWAGGMSNDYYRWHNGQLSDFTIHTPAPNSVITQIYHKNDLSVVVGSSGFRFIEKGQIRDVAMPGGKAIYIDTLGLNWIAFSALVRMDRARMYRLSSDLIRKSDPTIVEYVSTYSLIPDENRLWAGTKKGVYRIDIANPRKLKVLPMPEGPITVLNLYKKNHILLAGTDSKGLWVYKDEKPVQQITKRSGLGSNSIYSLKPGFDPNTVFISHNAGVDQLHLSAGRCKITNLNRSLGIGQTRVNDTEIVGDTLFIATDEALLAVSKKDIRGITVRPRISIQKVTANDTRILNANAQLDYHQNDIQIFFGGISFRSGKNIRYRYKLEGYDRKWTMAVEPDVRYRALPPGQYRFTVTALNVSGMSSAPASYSFTIQQPFWLRWPFIIVLVLAISGLVYTLWRRRLKLLDAQFTAERARIQRERDRAQLEKKAAELEQKVLLMQMNPHFIFNALNTIKGYYSERNDDLAGTYITKFSRLLRLLLENAEQQISLATEIQMLTLYIDLALIRYPDAFTYRIDCTPDLNLEEIAIPTLLLQPLIENAIIHGLAPKKTKGLLEVLFRREGDQLVCIVQDDGIGREASTTRNRHRDHDGKAMDITRERLQLMASNPGETAFQITDRYADDGTAAGTTVTLIIPLKTIW